MLDAVVQPRKEREKLMPHKRTPMMICNKARRHRMDPKFRITIRVQTTPEIRLPKAPNNTAKNPTSKLKAIKQQTGGANSTAKNSGQFARSGCAKGAIGGFSSDNSFPQNGQLAAG
jgi:hypothetical protein